MRSLAKIVQALFFLIVVGGVLLISDLSNRKKQKTVSRDQFKIAIVHWVDGPAIENTEEGIFDGLASRGLTRGGNCQIDIYKASNDISMLNSILNQVRTIDYDLVFTSCTPALQSAINIITDKPVVFTCVADPILIGAGTDNEHHIKNITGCSVTSDFHTMCQLIRESAPQIKTLGTIYCPGEVISVKFKEDFYKIAKSYDLDVKFFPANSPGELPDAVLGMTNSKIDAVCQMGDNLMSSGISTLIKGVVKANLPYFEFNQRPPGPMQSLVQIDVDYFQNGYDASMQAADILLKGISPADIPFQLPSKVSMDINPVKAEKYGITFSEEIRKQARNIIGEKEAFKQQQKFAMVHYVSSPDCDDVTKGILYQLNQLGHKQNDDFIFDEYNANADIATLNNIVKVVSEKEYDVIFVTVLAATQALAAKITDVPILFTVVADPVGNGLGESYSKHQSNVTGIDGMSYTTRGVNLVKAYLPNIKRMGMLFNPGEMASISGLKEMEKSCQNSDIELVSVPVHAVSEVTDATTLLCMKDIDAICQLPDNCTIPSFSSMIKVTRKKKMPLFAFITSQVEMGAIAGVAGDYFQQGIEIANMGIEVVEGEKVSDIPFSRIKSIKTVINPEAATAYGLNTPDELYKTADEIIGKK